MKNDDLIKSRLISRDVHAVICKYLKGARDDKAFIRQVLHACAVQLESTLHTGVMPRVDAERYFTTVREETRAALEEP